MNRNRRAQLAQESVQILDTGGYISPGSHEISIRADLAVAVERTRLYRPAEFDTALSLPAPSYSQTVVEVTGETTLDAAARLVSEGGGDEPLCLNFASAKNPGGGFLSGSQAQEESLARASGLYACLLPHMELYEYHRARPSALYSNHMIYSPGVPVFRADTGQLLETPYRVAFLSVPAVNAGAVRKNEPAQVAQIEAVMRARLERVLWVARQHGHRTLILGAWGCGVFANEPEVVARLFAEQLLGSGRFAGQFARLVFAVYDRTESQEVLGAFQRELSSIRATGVME
jgi:uncharacterized protein (TIGR02452 family)